MRVTIRTGTGKSPRNCVSGVKRNARFCGAQILARGKGGTKTGWLYTYYRKSSFATGVTVDSFKAGSRCTPRS